MQNGWKAYDTAYGTGYQKMWTETLQLRVVPHWKDEKIWLLALVDGSEVPEDKDLWMLLLGPKASMAFCHTVNAPSADAAMEVAVHEAGALIGR